MDEICAQLNYQHSTFALKSDNQLTKSNSTKSRKLKISNEKNTNNFLLDKFKSLKLSEIPSIKTSKSIEIVIKNKCFDVMVTHCWASFYFVWYGT